MPAQGLTGQLLRIFFVCPTPLVLLAIAIFYLWVYMSISPAPQYS